jgi:hypothetical protein
MTKENIEKTERLIGRFIRFMGEPIYSRPVPQHMIKYFDDLLIKDDGDASIVVQLWKRYGFSGYRNGLFWIVDPREYYSLTKLFDELNDEAIVFGRSATGNLFLWQWIKTIQKPKIAHFNVHTRKLTYVSDNMRDFFHYHIISDKSWQENFSGGIEFSVIEKYELAGHDECYAFFPPLVLGGRENIAQMEKVKMKEHLAVLAQLH